jgi:acyl-CoA thioesterase-1
MDEVEMGGFEMNRFGRWLGVALLALWAGAAQAKDCTLLILGDSLSSGHGLKSGSGWVELLARRAAPRGWKVVNASVAGDTTQNGLARLGPALARHRPAVVAVELGGNDALRGTPPATIRKHLAEIVRQSGTAGARVALLEAPVLPNYGRAYAQAVSRVYAGLAREEKLAHVPCFVCSVGVEPALMQADGLHPNEAAQPRVLETVWPVLEKMLGVCGK